MSKRAILGLMLVLVPSLAAAQLPDPGMEVDLGRTALVVTDPQNDFLSEKGVTWGVVGESVKENKTVEHLSLIHI